MLDRVETQSNHTFHLVRQPALIDDYLFTFNDLIIRLDPLDDNRTISTSNDRLDFFDLSFPNWNSNFLLLPPPPQKAYNMSNWFGILDNETTCKEPKCSKSIDDKTSNVPTTRIRVAKHKRMCVCLCAAKENRALYQTARGGIFPHTNPTGFSLFFKPAPR